ncbi:hypothetical protein APR04_004574 [Promicromonospora umidemergens]|uniref:Membrane protein DUF2238 n=1 Tax=Promicromonospora umidemergens TaxID=629679 RepID=A0ABP8XLS1_9MICO|nr:hypothetical protein [Promicromonospora umidemergens]MCP2285639.1 hypothetical protein [Promicromonospora umidemergens]
MSLVPGDVVRAAAVGSLAVGIVALGGVAGALFLLVLGGVLVPRFLGLPTALDLCFGSSLLLAAWASQLGWYEAVPWLDLLVHAVCTGLVAAVGVIIMVRGQALEAGALPGRARVGLAATTMGVGALSAIVWELGEWVGHTYLDEGIDVGYTDTIADLAFGLFGAMLTGVVLAVRDPAWRLGRDA